MIRTQSSPVVYLQGPSNSLLLDYVDKFLNISDDAPNVLVVPTDSQVPFRVGAEVYGMASGPGQLTITPFNGTVTVNSPETFKIRKQWSCFVLKKIGPNSWALSGDLELA